MFQHLIFFLSKPLKSLTKVSKRLKTKAEKEGTTKTWNQKSNKLYHNGIDK